MQLLENIWDNENLVKTLGDGGVAVMPTDTVYGIVGKAENAITVQKIYNIRKRNPEKPCIILIGNEDEIKKFSIALSEEQKKIIKKQWPGKVSIILDCTDDTFEYLHRGTKTLAFRLPDSAPFRELLMKTGPLVAPSANPEGFPTARNITTAKGYFGDFVDFYLDGGEIIGNPSKIIRVHTDGTITVIRE